MKNLVGVVVVWMGCAFAWAILGTSTVVRSGGADSSLRGAVHGLWGPEASQLPPTVRILPRPMASMDGLATLDGQPIGEDLLDGTHEQAVPSRHLPPDVPSAISLAGSEVSVELDLEHRQKGLLWFPTYTVSFLGVYRWDTSDIPTGPLEFRFPLASAGTRIDGFSVERDGRPVPFEVSGGMARWQGESGDDAVVYRVSYRSRGVGSWTYVPAEDGEVSNFGLRVAVNDEDINFADRTPSPTSQARNGGGWQGEWRFSHLISNDPISIELPQRINPGPLASRITFFAPVSLLFFFFVVALVARTRSRRLHPMHFFFLGCSFFAFHLLFSYLVDHVPLGLSFILSSVVSLGLSVSYARLVVGTPFALRVIGGAQFLYLVLFSASFFLDGFTGLTITIGAIVTLFVMMQLTAKTNWFERTPSPPGAPGGGSFPGAGGERASQGTAPKPAMSDGMWHPTRKPPVDMPRGEGTPGPSSDAVQPASGASRKGAKPEDTSVRPGAF